LFRRESIHDELPNQTENKSLYSCQIGRYLEKKCQHKVLYLEKKHPLQ